MAMDNYYQKRYNFFKWRCEQSTRNKIVMALGMAIITGIMAQIVIPLPWTPVPVTAQTFAVLFSGILLGRYWGGLSQAIYVFMGIAGVPWFAGMSGGFGILLGATGGYLVGFILAALFMGYFTDKYVRSRSLVSMLGLMSIANFGLIYIPGLIGLGVWIYLIQGTIPNLMSLLAMGAIPFLIGDTIKIFGAASLAKAVTPKQNFQKEVDVEKNRNWRFF
ncbi:MAG: biotin transporter BioY [Methanobacteriaceae archaeon]|nr:biotin transporter BioY [Methanobacteriaceae archaeon]